jgi:hypothetical protein
MKKAIFITLLTVFMSVKTSFAVSCLQQFNNAMNAAEEAHVIAQENCDGPWWHYFLTDVPQCLVYAEIRYWHAITRAISNYENCQD